MNYQQERDEFLTIMAAEGVSLEVIRLTLRHTQTLHRLSVAMCNGDYPCDNGERKVKECAECASLYAPSSLTKAGICPDCRTAARVKTLLEPFKVEPIFNGDPRGSVVLLKVPSGRTNDWGKQGICVPVRDR